MKSRPQFGRGTFLRVRHVIVTSWSHWRIERETLFSEMSACFWTFQSGMGILPMRGVYDTDSSYLCYTSAKPPLSVLPAACNFRAAPWLRSRLAPTIIHKGGRQICQDDRPMGAKIGKCRKDSVIGQRHKDLIKDGGLERVGEGGPWKA